VLVTAVQAVSAMAHGTIAAAWRSFMAVFLLFFDAVGT